MLSRSSTTFRIPIIEKKATTNEKKKQMRVITYENLRSQNLSAFGPYKSYGAGEVWKYSRFYVASLTFYPEGRASPQFEKRTRFALPTAWRLAVAASRRT
jgi:hypothetical protein